MSTTKTLTVVQLLILTTAAQRVDHMVMPLPPTIRARGGAQRNLLAALLKMQLVEEVPVDDAAIAGRTDEASRSLGLRLTAAGLAVIGSQGSPSLAEAEPVDDRPPTSEIREPGDAGQAPALPGADAAQVRRPTGKLGDVLQAISAEAGATLDKITTLTGWLAPGKAPLLASSSLIQPASGYSLASQPPQN